MRRRFFVEHFDSDRATLAGESAVHLGRVLRAEPGQLYELSDGQSIWLARVERVAPSKRGDSRVEFALVEPIASTEPSMRIVLLVSIIKFDRFEWCLEKATELGVAEIIPLAAARTDKALLAAAGKRMERWNRILLESAQQSRRLRAPVLQVPIRPGEAFSESAATVKIFLSERPEAKPLRAALDSQSAAPRQPSSAVLAIGPEGGWIDQETVAARANGFLEASLGGTILRTETAVISALSVMRFALLTD